MEKTAEAERSILGSMLVNGAVIPEIVSTLSGPADFFSDRHRAIFKAILAVSERGDGADLLTVRTELGADVESVGGMKYLAQLSTCVPTTAHARSYARILRDEALKRDVVDACGRIVQRGMSETGSAAEYADWAHGKIGSICARGLGGEPVSMRSALQSTIARIEAEQSQTADETRTGLEHLDEIIGPLQPGSLIVIAGRPSMGKTTLALQIVANVCQTKEALLCSLEMTAEQCSMALLSSASGVDVQALRRRSLQGTEAIWSQLADAGGRLARIGLHIDDKAGQSARDIVATARTFARRHKPALICVDYLQRIRMDGNRRRHEDLGDATDKLKTLSRELQCPVVLLSQLSRSLESRTDRRPMLSDLRESGAIEEHADVVIMLYRASYYEPKRQWELDTTTELLVRKNRLGPTGDIKTRFDMPHSRFERLDKASW